MNLFINLFIYLSIQFIYLSFYLKLTTREPTSYAKLFISWLKLSNLCFYLCIYISIFVSIFVSLYQSIYLSIFVSIYLSFFLYLFLHFFVSIYLSIFVSISIYLSFYLKLTTRPLHMQSFYKFHILIKIIFSIWLKIIEVYIYIQREGKTQLSVLFYINRGRYIEGG